MSRRSRDPAYRAEFERLLPFERIARMVIEMRTARGWTQHELAQRMGTSHSVISRIESGRHQTSVETLKRLAAAFDTHVVVGFRRALADQTELVSLN
jgi:transcriptional regulator with XRE-family HTH domain